MFFNSKLKREAITKQINIIPITLKKTHKSILKIFFSLLIIYLGFYFYIVVMTTSYFISVLPQ